MPHRLSSCGSSAGSCSASCSSRVRCSVFARVLFARAVEGFARQDTSLWRRRAFTVVACTVILLSGFELVALFIGRAPEPIGVVLGWLAPLHVVNTYGLFAVMTTERPEIIVEGSNDGQTWVEYEFRYKPGDVRQPPAWAAPHQPRLDWQLWFAA